MRHPLVLATSTPYRDLWAHAKDQSTMDIMIEIGGWIGMLMVLGAYVLVSTGRLAPVTVAACSANMVGSSLLALSSGNAQNWPVFTLNAIWAMVAAWGLVRLLRAKPTV
jgi:hypothetical protein